MFGSRARGDFSKESDWDILIIAKEKVPYRKILKVNGDIRRELAPRGIAIDILMISKEDIERVKDDKGYVYYYALREGKTL